MPEHDVGHPTIVVAAHRSDVGRVRAHNEDSALVGRQVWAVADGMGGHAAGDTASALVVAGLRRLDEAPHLTPSDIVAAIEDVHERILDHGEANPDARGLGSTVTGLAALDVGGMGHWAIFNVGDSRVYRFAEGTLTRATIDHSEAEELMLEGVLTTEEARTHRGRNIVTRSLGQPDACRADLWLLPRVAGERFLVCSDGLSGEVTDHDLAAILADEVDPALACERLVAAALASGGRDNITTIVVDVLPAVQA